MLPSEYVYALNYSTRARVGIKQCICVLGACQSVGKKCFKQVSLGFVFNAHDIHSVLYLIQVKVLHML